MYFYFVRDLYIGLHYLSSLINTHCIKSKYSNKQILKHYMFFTSAQLKILCIFSSSGTLILVYALSAIRMERICGAPSLFLAAHFENIVQFYFFSDLDGALSYLDPRAIMPFSSGDSTVSC